MASPIRAILKHRFLQVGPRAKPVSVFLFRSYSEDTYNRSIAASCGVNLGLRGLESTEEFIYKVATAVDQNDIFEVLAAKIRHSKQMAEDFKQNRLFATMFA